MKKKYVIVGVGGRANSFYQALVSDFKEQGELCGFCDVNQARMNHANSIIVEDFGEKPIRTYKAEDFDLKPLIGSTAMRR